MTHVSIDPVKVTIKRVWNDLSRKLLAFLAGGLTGSALVAGLDYLGVHLEPALASTIVVVVASVAGYIKKEVAVLDGGKPIDDQPAVTNVTPVDSARSADPS